MSSAPQPQCQVILTLAHLLRQHSLSYDDEKNLLLDVSVKCGLKLANQGTRDGSNDADENNSGGDKEGEVHMVLTGSPRPTFAETNAWLLESQAPPPPGTPKARKMMGAEDRQGSAISTPGSMRGSYSILDNNVQSMDQEDDGDESMGSGSGADDVDAIMANAEAGPDATEGEAAGAAGEEGREEAGGAELLQEYVAECTHNSSTRNANMDDLGGSPTRLGGSVLSRYKERKYSHGDVGAGGVKPNVIGNEHSADADHDDIMRDGDSSGNVISNLSAALENSTAVSKPAYVKKQSEGSSGPMVGHAVVDAVSKTHGVGLQSSRAKLLQGTIDRPLWDQRRWTDGECLFSELVDRCGLESFENVGVAGSHLGKVQGGGADAAAGGGRPGASLGTTGLKLQKTTNLSAHLITVPATIITQPNTAGEVPGLAEDTVEEIARGILRTLKRKKSPPASKVYLVLPPDNSGRDAERREAITTLLAAAFQKLEQYNDMIGAPRLMADAQMEFLNV